MDDLISRKAAIEYFMINTIWYDEEGNTIDDWDEKRKLIKNYFKKFFIEKDAPKSTDVTLRGLNRNRQEYVVTIPTFPIKKDGYHTEPCYIRAGKRK